jgi:hypothetical protein
MFQARQMITESAEGVALADHGLVRQYVNKWDPLLEGIGDELDKFAPRGQSDYIKSIAAFMLENQAKHLKRLSEETRALSVGPFLKFVFPVIRRAAVRLVATQIASVQPMTGPIGGVAFYRPRYASDKGQIAAGTEMNKVFNKWYSSNFIDGESMGLGSGTNTAFSRNLAYPRVLAGTMRVLVRTAGTTSSGTLVATDNGTGGFTPVAGATPALAGGTVNYQSGQTQVNFTAAPASNEEVLIEYRYDNELNPRLPEVQLDIAIQEIRAESRKLKSLASVEAADDLRALWGRDIDADLVAHMSDEMTAEIDREIAGTALNAVEPDAILDWDRAVPSGVSDPEHLQSLVIRLSEASHLAHRRTQRAPCNWIITSSEVAALLDTMPGFASVDEGHVYQGGIMKGGVLNRKWVVYVDPLFPQDEILMGYQGPSILDTGLIYSPYVPMEITPNFVDPNDFSLRRAIRTRHKITLIRPEFFTKVKVSNLN